MSEPLKPCPFCGGEGTWNPSFKHGCVPGKPNEPARWFIDCTACAMTMGPRAPKEAADLWNRRAPPPAGEVKALWVYDDKGNVSEMLPDPQGDVLATFDPDGVVTLRPPPGKVWNYTSGDAYDRPVCPESHLNAEEGE